ncbi:histone-fold-containing protein [Melanogaster broomeanus]|nr:histone-fold-containing protein [Melanogaster broomeanus]
MKTKNKQTKFPVARIKKIMQKDEEVGKVAQATPVVISKALELFLALIVEEASKKVEAYHLKHAVDTTEMLDFLKEIVESVTDPSAGGTVDLEAEAAEGRKRKRGKAKKSNPPAAPKEPKRRRKKKGNVDADDDGEEAGGGVKSEAEADAAMDEEDERDNYAESSHRDQDGDWRDEDAPYVPR